MILTQCTEMQHNLNSLRLKLQPAAVEENGKNTKAQKSPYPGSREGYLNFGALGGAEEVLALPLYTTAGALPLARSIDHSVTSDSCMMILDFSSYENVFSCTKLNSYC